MRVNIYAEELTRRIEIHKKEIGGQVFTGLRIYLYLPVTSNAREVEMGRAEPVNYVGPFYHGTKVGLDGVIIDDDSSAITIWGKRDLRVILRDAIAELDKHYNDGPDSA